ncbi:MAG: signal peptidase II, partial [Lacipirellulaceae bacterium]
MTNSTAQSVDYPSSRYALFFVPAVLGLAADLWTKSWTFAQPELFQGAQHWWLWEEHAGIQLSLNEGALFGMGQGKVWFFTACSVLAGIAIPVWLFRFGAATDAKLTFALGAIMGGVFGNLYDRLGLHDLQWERFRHDREGAVYAVRDWILLQWNDQWVWPNFNIADVLLVCGAASLFLISVFSAAP